jgi:hypothetical protein
LQLIFFKHLFWILNLNTYTYNANLPLRRFDIEIVHCSGSSEPMVDWNSAGYICFTILHKTLDSVCSTVC